MHVLHTLFHILPTIILIALGHLFKKFQLFDQHVVSGMKSLINNVTLPALIFLALTEVHFEISYIYVYSAIIIPWLLILIAAGKTGLKIKLPSYYFPLLITGGEGSMFGLAVYVATFGMSSLKYFAIVNAANMMFFIFITLPLLLRRKSDAKSVKDSLKAFLSSPMIWTLILGLIAGSSGFYTLFQNSLIGGVAEQTLTWLSQPTIPLIGLIIGYELSFSPHRLAAPFKTALIRLFIMLPCGLLLDRLLIVHLLHYNSMIQAAFLTVWLLPPSFSVPMFLKPSDADNREYVMNTISMYIVISFILYTVIM